MIAINLNILKHNGLPFTNFRYIAYNSIIKKFVLY